MVALLSAQVALLWLQGALLNRQRAELASLKSEIRELAIAINEAILIEDDQYATPAAFAAGAAQSSASPGKTARR
jgi:hypothetical protein